MGAADLEFMAAALTLWAVNRIAALDLRGQYAMIGAQIAWGAWAAWGAHWFALAQSVALMAFTVRAIVTWRRAGIRPHHDA